jgi:hypothetical protein
VDNKNCDDKGWKLMANEVILYMIWDSWSDCHYKREISRREYKRLSRQINSIDADAYQKKD